MSLCGGQTWNCCIWILSGCSLCRTYIIPILFHSAAALLLILLLHIYHVEQTFRNAHQNVIIVKQKLCNKLLAKVVQVYSIYHVSIYLHTKKLHKKGCTETYLQSRRGRGRHFLKLYLLGKINYSRGIVYATNWNYEIIYKNYCASIFWMRNYNKNVERMTNMWWLLLICW